MEFKCKLNTVPIDYWLLFTFLGYELGLAVVQLTFVNMCYQSLAEVKCSCNLTIKDSHSNTCTLFFLEWGCYCRNPQNFCPFENDLIDAKELIFHLTSKLFDLLDIPTINLCNILERSRLFFLMWPHIQKFCWSHSFSCCDNSSWKLAVPYPRDIRLFQLLRSFISAAIV